MTTISSPPTPIPPATDLTRTARVTGAWYLGLAITGLLGFIIIRAQIFDPASAQATFDNLVEKSALAALDVALELAIVLTQAVVAVWFFKLLRSANPVCAVAVMVFGMANAVAIMASATFMGTALTVTTDPSLAAPDGPATVQLLYTLSSNAWVAGSIFFGLWLVPMGWAVLTCGLAPRLLGWALVVGGVGYVASAVLGLAVPDAPAALADVLTFPSAIGEFWMIAYLLVWGVRRTANAQVTR